MTQNKIFSLLFLLIFSSSNLVAQEIEGYFKNLAGSVSNQRVSQVLTDVFNQRSQPKLKLRGSAGANIFTKLGPSVVLIVADEGIGTGSIISKDGRIITNWHVVEDNEYLKVVFMPRGLGATIDEASVAEAKVIHLQKEKDLALLQIFGWSDPLPQPIELGSMADIQIGLDTHAIGHPEGQFWTYTRGYISQYRPNYEWTYDDKSNFTANVIQTQTPINPGNSGGPLINEKGKLIGVNSFKGDGEGLNFAVAFNEVEEFLKGAPNEVEATRNNQCEPKITNEFRSKNNDGDVVLYDRDCNDVPDLSVYYPDATNGDIIVDHDDNEDGKIDGTIVDEGSDGRWNYSLWDSDFDGKWDLEGVHPDGEINPSSLKKIG